MLGITACYIRLIFNKQSFQGCCSNGFRFFSPSSPKVIIRLCQEEDNISYIKDNTSMWTNKTYNGEHQKHLNFKLIVRVSPWIIYKPLHGWWVYSTYFFSFWDLFEQGPHAKLLPSSLIMTWVHFIREKQIVQWTLFFPFEKI